jgi:hypothetical protein
VTIRTKSQSIIKGEVKKRSRAIERVDELDERLANSVIKAALTPMTTRRADMILDLERKTAVAKMMTRRLQIARMVPANSEALRRATHQSTEFRSTSSRRRLFPSCFSVNYLHRQ